MKRSWWLTTIAAVAMALPAVAHENGDVTAISILPGPGRAVMVVDVTGAVSVQDFTLDGPPRLVVDVVGANLRAPGVTYDGANRGGILDVRYSQFRTDVVRIVIELDRQKSYQLDYIDDTIRVAFAADQSFGVWSSGQLIDGLARDDDAGLTAPPAGPPPVASPVAAAQQSQQPRITVSYDSTHISDVVAGFSAFSGRSIVIGEAIDLTIRGTQILDQPWDVAFQQILEANGLRGVEDAQSGIIVVQRPDAEAAADSINPKSTAIVKVNFKSAAQLVPVLQSIVGTRNGTVIADSSTNQLIVTDARNRIAEDTALIRQLDVPTAQVSIQAKLVFVDRTDIEQLGVQYDLGNRNQFFNRLIQRPDPSTAVPVDLNNDGVPDALGAAESFDQDVNIIDLGGNSLSAIGNAEAVIPSPALQLIFSTAIGSFNLTSFVNALQQVNLADLQAEPLIATTDNTAASVLVGERTPLRVIDAGAQTGDQGQAPRATVQFEETGIRLEVTPHVTNAGQVLMNIRAENSSIRQEVALDLGFTFQTQQAISQILVNNGETAVIGGLTVTQVTVSKTGIPFLVDLPIVGRVFGFTSRNENRRDLLILVTPTIVDNPAGLTQDR